MNKNPFMRPVVSENISSKYFKEVVAVVISPINPQYLL